MITYYLRKVAEPFEPTAWSVVYVLAENGVSANFVTVTGLVLALVAAGLCGNGNLLFAGIVLGLSGICDMLDGAIARSRGAKTNAGAYLDSTCDRLADGSVLVGIIWWSHVTNNGLLLLLAAAALLGSFQVSYNRARAQSLGHAGLGGWFTRPLRIIVLMIGLLWGTTLPFAIGIIAIGSWCTTLDRGIRSFTALRMRESGRAV